MTDTAERNTTFHTDHVGSLLRPDFLLEARAQRARGEIDDTELAAQEDLAIDQVLAAQREIGLDVLTDGEYRRGWFGESLQKSVTGLAEGPVRQVRRAWVGADEHATQAARHTPDELVSLRRSVRAVDRVRATRSIAGHEYAYLRDHAGGARVKITTMGPTAHTEGLFVPGASPAYERGIELLADLTDIIRQDAVDLAHAGLPYFQLDSLAYILRFGDPIEAQTLADILGVSVGEAVDYMLAADNTVLDAARQAGAVTAVHMCRGNSRSAWNPLAGTYEVARRALAELHTDRLLLEFDTDRAGGFEPLAEVPETTTVVLGLVSSKFPRLESRDELLARIDQAAQYHNVEHLALSPQCGFASTAPGNLISWDDQRRKLERIVAVAEEVWGR